MLDTITTVSPLALPAQNVGDYSIPKQGIIFPNPLGDNQYSLDFQVLDGDQVVITAYGMNLANQPSLEPTNNIELYKIMYSMGRPHEYTANCSPCGNKFKPEEISAIVQEVRICDINITKCKPLLIINVTGRYRLKLGEGIAQSDDILIHMERINSRAELGFKNI